MTKDEALKMAIAALVSMDYLGKEKSDSIYYRNERFGDDDQLADVIQACKEALEQPQSLGDFDAMSQAECVDYILYLRKEIDLLRFKEWKGLSNDMVRAIGEKCEEKNRGILNWIDFYNGIENMLKDKNYE
jgi:hypothetical protein